MTIQFSTSLQNARSNQIEGDTGTSAILVLYDLTGASPANCEASITGTTLVTMNLPSDYMNTSSGGSVTKNGTWSASASVSGVADFFRLFKSDGTTCQIQGTVTLTSGGGDMELDNTNIATSQTVTVNTFTFTDGNP